MTILPADPATRRRIRYGVAVASRISAFTLVVGVAAGIGWCWLGTLYAVSTELRD